MIIMLYTLVLCDTIMSYWNSCKDKRYLNVIRNTCSFSATTSQNICCENDLLATHSTSYSATKYTLNIQPPWHTWTKELYPSVHMDIFISVYHDGEPGSVNYTWMVTVADTCRCAWNLDPSSNSLVYMCNLRNVQTCKPITVSLSLSLSHTRHPPFPVSHTHTHLRRHTWEGWRRAVCSAFRSIVINCSVNRGGSTSPALRLLQSCRARLCSALHNGMP